MLSESQENGLFIAFIIPFGLLGIMIATVLIYNAFKQHKKIYTKLPIEEDLTPQYSQIASGSYKGLNLRGPFVRLTFYDTFLVFMHIETVIIYYKDILDLELLGLFKTSIRITYLEGNKKRQLVISPRNAEKCFLYLKQRQEESSNQGIKKTIE